MSTKNDFLHVPYGKTVHGEEEIEAVVNVLRTSTQMGKNVREFEEKVAALYDKKHWVMVNSGSSALYLAVDLLHPLATTDFGLKTNNHLLVSGV